MSHRIGGSSGDRPGEGGTTHAFHGGRRAGDAGGDHRRTSHSAEGHSRSRPIPRGEEAPFPARGSGHEQRGTGAPHGASSSCRVSEHASSRRRTPPHVSRTGCRAGGGDSRRAASPLAAAPYPGGTGLDSTTSVGRSSNRCLTRSQISTGRRAARGSVPLPNPDPPAVDPITEHAVAAVVARAPSVSGQPLGAAGCPRARAGWGAPTTGECIGVGVSLRSVPEATRAAGIVPNRCSDGSVLPPGIPPCHLW
jgi:hypothetical protein